MSQLDYLLNGDIQDQRTIDVRHIVDRNPGQYHVFQDNPLNEGCFLHSITSKEGKEHV